MLIAAVAPACAPAAVVDPAKCKADAEQFWTEFRAAALAGDAARLAPLTRFPVAVEGELDDAQPSIGRTDFAGRLAAVLAADSGLKPTAYPVRSLIADTARPTDVSCRGDTGEFRIGNMLFEWVSGEWKLVKLYLE